MGIAPISETSVAQTMPAPCHHPETGNSLELHRRGSHIILRSGSETVSHELMILDA
jgi:hypothetical protein